MPPVFMLLRPKALLYGKQIIKKRRKTGVFTLKFRLNESTMSKNIDFGKTDKVQF